jgi:hypothetical protein
VCVDARKTLPVDAGSFDAVICIASINHTYERSAVLREWLREPVQQDDQGAAAHLGEVHADAIGSEPAVADGLVGSG